MQHTRTRAADAAMTCVVFILYIQLSLYTAYIVANTRIWAFIVAPVMTALVHLSISMAYCYRGLNPPAGVLGRRAPPPSDSETPTSDQDH